MQFFLDELQRLREAALYRKMREVSCAPGALLCMNGMELLNFSSNDYLGLANDPRLVESACTALERFGLGAGASRLVCGNTAAHRELEEALAEFKRTEAAISFSSGYSMALGIIPALAGKGDVIILDKLCHACLVDGARLSGAALRVFPHNDLDKLQSHLVWARKKSPGAKVLLMTESVFSMDGDSAPLREIVEIKEKFGAYLLLDEAHAVGVLGDQGRGLADALGVADRVEFQMGTLGKALGVSGGYLCGSRLLIDFLINKARSFIYSTAPPPALAAAAAAAIAFLQSEEGSRRLEKLWDNIRFLSGHLPGRIEKATPQSAILPWVIGKESLALKASEELFQKGFFAPAIRYPTVAKGSARLRITLSAAHNREQLKQFADALASVAGNF